MTLNMRKITFILLAALLVGLPIRGMAIDADAGQPGAFLSYGAGSRAMGMGRAFAGVADDATAIFWNPGGLTAVNQNQVLLQYMSLMDGNNFQYLGYSHILPYVGTLGVGLVFLNQGAAEGRDAGNKVTENFTNNQFAFLGGFGMDVTSQLAAGGTVKIVNQTMMSLSATGFGLDLGLIYHPFPFLNLGLSLQNLVSPSIKLKETADVYPMNMTLGIASKILGDKLIGDVDLSKNMDQDQLKVRFGLEGSPFHNIFIRAGYDLEEFTGGLGYRYSDFQLDYAIGFLTEDESLLHRVDLSYYFGGFVLEAHPEPDKFSPVGINKVTIIKLLCQTKLQVRVWTVEIFNDSNTSVKKFSGEGSPPDHIVWDGMEDNLNPMPDGKYKVVFTIEDAAGDAKQAPLTYVTIQSVLPLGVSPLELE